MQLPKAFRTARVRLLALYLLLFIGSVVALEALLFWQLRATLQGELRTQITTEVNLLLFEYREDGLSELLEEIEERIDKNSPRQRLSYMVQNAAGQVIFDRIAPVAEPYGWQHINDSNGNVAEFYFSPLEAGYVLGVGKDLGALAELKQAIGNALIGVLLAAVVLGSLGGWILSRRTLAQVEAINHTARAIGGGRWGQRIAVQHTGDEFDELSQTLNHMFDRIEQLVANVRQVSTGIAHDLRTPLARLRNQLEQMRAQPPADLDGALVSAMADVDAILHTFAALLRLAELEAGTLRAGFKSIDLHALAQHMVEAYQPLGEDCGIALTFVMDKGAACTIRGDKNLLQQLLANVFENALQHLEPGCCVEVRVYRRGAQVMLHIADNGPGIPASERARIIQPFQRLDPAGNGGGSGLGLALVAAIAQLHGSELQLRDNVDATTQPPRHPGLLCELGFDCEV